jgi:hypothetical protein
MMIVHHMHISPPRLGKLAQRRRPNKIPCPTRTRIDPALVPEPIDAVSKKGVRRFRVDESEVRVEDTAPAALWGCDMLASTYVEKDREKGEGEGEE